MYHRMTPSNRTGSGAILRARSRPQLAVAALEEYRQDFSRVYMAGGSVRGADT